MGKARQVWQRRVAPMTKRSRRFLERNGDVLLNGAGRERRCCAMQTAMSAMGDRLLAECRPDRWLSSFGGLLRLKMLRPSAGLTHSQTFTGRLPASRLQSFVHVDG